MERKFKDILKKYEEFSFWSVLESVAILRGLDPESITDETFRYRKFNEIHEMLYTAIYSKEIQLFDENGKIIDVNPDQKTIDSISYIEGKTVSNKEANERYCELSTHLKDLDTYNLHPTEVIKWGENNSIGELAPKNKLKNCQKDKIKCQEIGKEVWKQYPILDIKHLKNHPEILKISGKNKTLYKDKTLHKWLSEVAPESASAKGRRSIEIQKQQKEICKKIGISL